MINRHRMRRLLAPTAGLRKPIVRAGIGLLVLLFGLSLSFIQTALPIILNLGKLWNGFIERWVGIDRAAQFNHVLGGVCLVLGFYLAFTGLRSLQRRFYQVMAPASRSDKIVNTFVRRQQLSAGPRIVAMGGGTGLSTLLRGLKHHTSNITAIVTVTDDGGSSGRLSREMGIVPPGDMRNCLVALADAEKLMTDLFQHRFAKAKGSLAGHSIGNLLIAGLVEQADGDLDRALAMASEVLNIRGRVLPSTTQTVRLRALMDDGSEVCGETTIVAAGKRIRRIYLDPMDVAPFPDASTAIEEADMIIIGPGSVFTSVIPNLLIPGMADAVHNAKAVKAYVCNVMTQPGESDSFTAAEHVTAIQANVDRRIFDHVLVNTGRPTQGTVDKYRNSDQYVVEADVERIRALGFRVVSGNFMNEMDYVRHDPLKVAARLMDVLNA